jgi:UDPglucose 6-dehydrogenase
MASAGHNVTGIDEDEVSIARLRDGKAPVFEPGLEELLASEIQSSRLIFSSQFEDARDADLLWIAYDTPVDKDDLADVSFVEERVLRMLPLLKNGAVILISSQVPVGFTGALSLTAREKAPNKHLSFVYSPENLRLGKAIQIFRSPDRVIVGFDGFDGFDGRDERDGLDGRDRMRQDGKDRHDSSLYSHRSPAM